MHQTVFIEVSEVCTSSFEITYCRPWFILCKDDDNILKMNNSKNTAFEYG